MARDLIDLGTAPNATDGDSLYDGTLKINDMFTELYKALSLDGNNIVFDYTTYTSGSGTVAGQVTQLTADMLAMSANQANLIVQMSNVYSHLGDGENLSFNVWTYSEETQTLKNKTIVASDNNLYVGLDDLWDVQYSPNTPSGNNILSFDSSISRWAITEPSVRGPVIETLLPNTDDTYDLGSLSNRFHKIFVANTIHLGGGGELTIDSNGHIAFNRPIAATAITTNVVHSMTVDTGPAIYALATAGSGKHTIFDNTSSSYIKFPFDTVEAESIVGSFDAANHEYKVSANGTYKVSLNMLAPSIIPNAEYRLVSTRAGVPTYYNPGYVFVGDSEQAKDYIVANAEVNDIIYVEYKGRFFQRSQFSLIRI